MKYLILSLLALLVSTAAGQTPTPAQISQAKQMLKNDPSLREELKKELQKSGEMPSVDYVDPNALLKKDTLGAVKDTLLRTKLTTYSVDTLEYFNVNQKDSLLQSKKDSIAAIQDSLANLPDSLNNDIFGRHLFFQNYKIETVADVPEDYQVVSGDQILVRLWGRYNLEKIYTVSQDGYVFIDPLNKQTYVKGMTNRRIKQMIQNIVSDMAGVEGEAKVISAHPVKLNISGEARFPGTILVPPYFTFWQALMISKGPDKLGSIRDIRLVREGKIAFQLDMYDFLQTGKMPNLGLQENDLIFYSTLDGIVKIKSGVKRPARYEIKKGDKLSDLIQYAGDFSAEKFSPILQVERIIPVEKRKTDGPTTEIIDVDLSQSGWKNFKLENGDIISAQMKNLDIDAKVSIMGKGIKVPGRYALGPQKNLLEVIAKAGGLTKGYNKALEIVRETTVGRQSIYVPIENPEALSSISLENRDSILTYHDSEFVDSTSIRVHGFVRDTLEFLYVEGLSLKNVINRAGGIREGGLNYVYIKRRDEFHKINYQRILLSEAETFILQRRDEVFAFSYHEFNREFPVIALMEGRLPLFLDYSADLNLEIIIHRLGGLLPNSDSTKVEINSPEFNSNDKYVSQTTVEISEETLHSRDLIVPGALVIIRGDAKKQAPGFVNFIGEFNSPGRYALRNSKESFSSLLKQAGGLSNRANPYSLAIHRVDVDKPLPIQIKNAEPLEVDGEWLLTHGDSIFVLRNDYMVEIEGAVLHPSVVQWRKNMNWKNYVDEGAGGELDTADIKRTYIIYPNGVTVKARSGWLGSAKIHPGSKIIVPWKPYKPPIVPKPPMEAKEFVAIMASVVGMFTAIITAYAIYQKEAG